MKERQGRGKGRATCPYHRWGWWFLNRALKALGFRVLHRGSYGFGGHVDEFA